MQCFQIYKVSTQHIHKVPTKQPVVISVKFHLRVFLAHSGPQINSAVFHTHSSLPVQHSEVFFELPPLLFLPLPFCLLHQSSLFFPLWNFTRDIAPWIFSGSSHRPPPAAMYLCRLLLDILSCHIANMLLRPASFFSHFCIPQLYDSLSHRKHLMVLLAPIFSL